MAQKNKEEQIKEVLRGFLFDTAMGAICAVAVFYLGYRRGYLLSRCACDAFFVAAVMLLGFGGLKAARNQGLFDVIGYGIKHTMEIAFPVFRREEKEDLYGYRERKAAERKTSKGLLLASALYFLLAFISLAVYMWL